MSIPKDSMISNVLFRTFTSWTLLNDVNLLFAIFVVGTSTGGGTEITTSNSSTLLYIVIGVIFYILHKVFTVGVLVVVACIVGLCVRKRYELLLLG